MLKMSGYSFIAGILSVALAIVFYLVAILSVRISARRTGLATAGGGSVEGGTSVSVSRGPGSDVFGTYGTLVAWLSFIFLLASMGFRAIATGHGPFANMYEFSIAFATGVIGVYLFFERRYHQRVLGLIALPVALLMLLYTRPRREDAKERKRTPPFRLAGGAARAPSRGPGRAPRRRRAPRPAGGTAGAPTCRTAPPPPASERRSPDGSRR